MVTHYRKAAVTAASIVFLAIFLAASPAFAAIGLVVDGQRLDTDVPPQINEGRTLVPLCLIGEALGMEVSWETDIQAAVLQGKGKLLKLPVGKTQAEVNGKAVTLDVPAVITEGRVMVPVRFVSEQFKAEVEWDKINQIVNITTLEEGKSMTENVPETGVETGIPTGLSGPYRMTGSASVLFPGVVPPQTSEVTGWFDLGFEEGDKKDRILKRELEGTLEKLVIPEVLTSEIIPDGTQKMTLVYFALLPDEVQQGEYDPETGEFWMVTTLSLKIPEMGSLSGPYTAVALERGTLNPATAVYKSHVSLTVNTGPFAGTNVLFSKNGSREDSLEDIRRLLEKENLTDAEKERIRNYLRESHASEAEKIEVIRDLIELAQEASGEAVLITPLEVIDAIIDGNRDIEERMYKTYRDMRAVGIIDGPEDFPNGTLEQRQKYEMRYLLERLKQQSVNH